MKRKLKENSSISGTDEPKETDNYPSDDELIFRPAKRMNMYYNTPKQFKDEKKRILKISKRKLKQIDEPELDLLRSVLINNTFRRLKMEFREERKTKLKLGRAYSPKRSPLASGGNDKLAVTKQAYYQATKACSYSETSLIDAKSNFRERNDTEQSLGGISASQYKQSICQYSDTQNLLPKVLQSPVAMETSENMEVSEVNTENTSQSSNELKINTEYDMKCCDISMRSTDERLESSHVSETDECKNTRANICAPITDNESDFVMEMTSQSDNEEIDVCSYTDEQTDTQTMVLKRSPLAVISCIEEEHNKLVVQNIGFEHQSSNSCLRANKDSCYQQGVGSETKHTNISRAPLNVKNMADIDSAFIPGYPWHRSNSESFSALSISNVINYAYIDSSSRNMSTKVEQKTSSKHSNQQSSLSQCVPGAAFGNTEPFHSPNIITFPAFHSSELSSLSEQGFYFHSTHSPNPVHYFTGEGPFIATRERPMLGLRTVNNCTRYKESYYNSASLMSCNLRTHPLLGDNVSRRVSQMRHSVTDMVACT